jgi:hypothetical protein
VDFNKAVESVNWEYLEEVMQYMGIGIKWLSLIHKCILGSQLAILINVFPSQEVRV